MDAIAPLGLLVGDKLLGRLPESPSRHRALLDSRSSRHGSSIFLREGIHPGPHGPVVRAGFDARFCQGDGVRAAGASEPHLSQTP